MEKWYDMTAIFAVIYENIYKPETFDAVISKLKRIT